MNKSILCLALGLVGIAGGVSTWAGDGNVRALKGHAPLTAQQVAARKARWEKLAVANRSGNQTFTPGTSCAAATHELGALPFNNAGTTVGMGDDHNLTNTYTGGYDNSTPCAGGGFAMGDPFNPPNDPRGNFAPGMGLGSDQAYRIRTDVGCTLSIQMDPTALDLGIFLHSAPACDGLGNLVCLDDSGGNGTLESVTLTAVALTDYFVNVDAYASGSVGPEDTYTLAIGGTGCTLVPVELQSFQIN